MTQADQVNEILKRKAYRSLNSPRLKATPDLYFPGSALSQDELAEAKLIYDYEQNLLDTKNKRGY